MEIEALKRHGTWRPANRPSAHGKVLPLTWVFKYKFKDDGFVSKFKARVCVRGDLQFWGSENTYAATLVARSFRLLMALTAKFDLETHQLDAVNAFTNSDLDEEIYVDWPPGYKNASNAH